MQHLNYFNPRRRLVFPILLFLAIVPGPGVSAQPGHEKGAPIITYYPPQVSFGNLTVWTITQDTDGVMYFGNTGTGITIFDGVSWNAITSDEFGLLRVVRILAKAPDGTIYYGAGSDFGWLERDSTGKIVARSLLHYVPKNKLAFTDVWSIQVVGNRVYFQSRERLFQFTRTGGGKEIKWAVRSWEPSTHFMYSFYLDHVLYLNQQGLGLFKMVADTLQLIPGSEFLGVSRMQIMLPYTAPVAGSGYGHSYLIGTFNKGFFIFDGKNFRPFHTQADSLWKNSTVYKALLLNGNYYISTTNDGMFQINPSGKLIRWLNTNSGLPNNEVLGLFADNSGNLWFGHEKGVSKMDFDTRFTQFNDLEGLKSLAFTVGRMKDGSLYAGTNQGLYKYDSSDSRFLIVPSTHNFQDFQTVADGNTLLFTGPGLYMIRDGKTIMVRPSIHSDLDVTRIQVSKKDPNLLLVGTTFGMTLFIRNPDTVTGWKFLGYFPKVEGETRGLEEDSLGHIWAGSATGSVYRITLDREKGIPDPHKSTVIQFSYGDSVLEGPDGRREILKDVTGNISKLGGKIYFFGDSTVYRFDPERNLLMRDFHLGHGLKIRLATADSSGRIWARISNTYAIGIQGPDGAYHFDSTTLLPLSDQIIVSAIPDINGIVWMGSTNGLFRFDPNKKVATQPPFHTLITSISTGKKVLDPFGQGPGQDKDVSSGDNSFRFEFAAPYFSQENKTAYQTRLVGFDTGWSAWGNNTYKEFTNLPYGHYRFQVRARNIYHKISLFKEFSFTILPPWYLTWWAYLLYAIIVALAISLLVKWRTRRLEAKHRELETVIRERTSELSERLEELALINAVQEALAGSLDSQAIYEFLGDRVRQQFNPDRVILASYDPDTHRFFIHYFFDGGTRKSPPEREPDRIETQVISTGKPVIIHNSNEGKEWFAGEVNKGAPVLSGLFVPFYHEKRVYGYIGLQSFRGENLYGDSHLRLMETLTSSMSIALENTRLFEETRRLLSEAKQRASELSTVNHISKAMSSHLDPNELIQLAGNQVRDLFRANIVYVALLNKKTQIIDFVYQHGEKMPSRRIGEGLTSQIILSGEPLLINKDMDLRKEELGIQSVGVPAASYLGVPIPVGEEIIGVISVQSTEQENRFNENDQRLLNTIASSVGVSLRNAQLFHDVQKARTEAETAGKAAEKANEAKSSFLSTVSHELRTPLTSVLGFAKIIQKRLEERIFPQLDGTDPRTAKATAQITENLRVVISEGERLTHLINDVLDLAKIEAGKMEWSQENVSIQEVVEKAIAATTSLFDQKPVTLIKEITEPVKDIIGDRDKLIQVVINLFSNAVKFTNEGTVTCQVFQRGSEVIVSVTDTGIGIAKKDYATVFEQFKQVGGDTLTDKPKGTGLGLPICKEIVEHHGGRIWVESEPGKGSSFSFALPIIPADQKGKDLPIHIGDLMKQLKEQIELPRANAIPSHAIILIVDDDDSIRSLLKQELEEAGYTVQQAENGKKALESVRQSRPDLIVLDVMMPEMNGFDLAAILKNDPQTMDIPILILSIVQDKTRGYRIGVDRYLTKPFNTAELFSEISNLLEKGQSRKKVMIVDEDAATVRSLTEVLVAKGYQVVEGGGEGLIERAKEMQPDIIMFSSAPSGKNEMVKTLRFEKGMENVLFFIYQ
jgi:signal transduction histidine kinase/DNA-binding response OmpR family regulator/ligand-binding sensor domain-containing protein